MALGSYSGDVGLYDGHTNQLQNLLQGQPGGVTQVRVQALQKEGSHR